MVRIKHIPWYDGRYSISETGIVYSNYNKSKELKALCLSKRKKWANYLSVWLSYKWKEKNFKVHRLVAKAFIPNPDNKLQINHKDWNQSNNHVDNLEWCTQSENMVHRFNVLWHKQPRKWRYWKNNPLARKIWKYNLKGDLLDTYYWSWDINRHLGFCMSAISNCASGRTKTSYWYIRKYI